MVRCRGPVCRTSQAWQSPCSKNTTKGRSKASEISYSAKQGESAKDIPIIVLVDGGSASASEILAGALQDDGRSLLLGDHTFGKGLIQTLTNLSDGSGLAVTVAGYVTPSGRDIQGQGIQPDRVLDQPEPLNPGGEGDRWLNDAERVLQALIEQENPSDQIQSLDSTDVASQPS